MRITFLFLLGLTLSQLAVAQRVTKAEFEAAVDYVNCRYAELSLKEQPKARHYVDFQQTVANKCNYYELYTFLNTRKPSPLSKSLYLCNRIEAYKKLYRPTYSNQKLYDLLTEGIFTDSLVNLFANNHRDSYPVLKSNVDANIRTRFLGRADELEEPVVREIPESYDDNTAYIDTSTYVEEFNEIEAPIIPTDYDENNDKSESSMRWLNYGKTILRFGLLLILLAILGYWIFQRYKDKWFKPKVQNPNPPVSGLTHLQDEIAALRKKVRNERHSISEIHDMIDDLEDDKK